jgi:outer membrane protein OmpA-like peptidoglycan-associated protein
VLCSRTGGADETSWFELRVVDETGEPVPGLEVRFSNGPLVTTDGDGVARWGDASGGSSSARLASVAAVRQALKPRWQRPRTARAWEGEPETSVQELDDELASVGLVGERRHTLVLTPYFRCTEVAGAHFDFGRSFLLPEALPTLAQVARALSADASRKAMLYGHSDKSGSEALNKSLSEKRGRALSAVFTHDAETWERMWGGNDGDEHWQEKWGAKQAKVMLNALGCPDDAGRVLVENGAEDAPYRQAAKRFQRGEYAKKPAAQAPLADDGIVGPKTRREMFLAYAKQVSTKPVETSRFTRFGAAGYMGCGEYNPLHASARDAESRRAVAFVYDVAAEPQGLPCRVGTIAPCQAVVAPEPAVDAPPEVDEQGKPKPPYRCSVYREVAKKCPCGDGVAEPLLWRVRPLEHPSEEPLRLVVREPGSPQESTLAPLTGGPDEQAFDLSHLDPQRTYELVAYQGERSLFLPCRIQTAALRVALAHDDLAALVRSYQYDAGREGVTPLTSLSSGEGSDAAPGGTSESFGWMDEV